jgi:hypothetical protein
MFQSMTGTPLDPSSKGKNFSEIIWNKSPACLIGEEERKELRSLEEQALTSREQKAEIVFEKSMPALGGFGLSARQPLFRQTLGFWSFAAI